MVAEPTKEPSKEPAKDREPVAQKPEAPRPISSAEPVAPKAEAPRAIPAAASSTPRVEAARTAAKPKTDPKQIVVTLSGETGEITKIEKFETTGRRSELSSQEFLELADEDDADEIEAVVDEVYRTAVADAMGEEEDDEEDLEFRRMLVGRLFVRRMLRRGARRMLVRRLLRTQARENKAQKR